MRSTKSAARPRSTRCRRSASSICVERRHQRLADRVDDGVGVALEHRGEALQLFEHRLLRGRLHRVEQRSGIDVGHARSRSTTDRPGRCERSRSARSTRTALAERLGPQLVPRTYSLESRDEPFAHPRHRTLRAVHDLAQREREPQVGERQRPVVGERVDVRRDEHEAGFARRAGAAGRTDRARTARAVPTSEPAVHAEHQRERSREHAGQQVRVERRPTACPRGRLPTGTRDSDRCRRSERRRERLDHGFEPVERAPRPFLAIGHVDGEAERVARARSRRRCASARRARGRGACRARGVDRVASAGWPVSGSALLVSAATRRANSQFTGPGDCSIRMSSLKSKPGPKGQPGGPFGDRRSPDQSMDVIPGDDRGDRRPGLLAQRLLPLARRDRRRRAHRRSRRARAGPPGAAARVPPGRHRVEPISPRCSTGSTRSCTSPASSRRQPRRRAAHARQRRRHAARARGRGDGRACGRSCGRRAPRSTARGRTTRCRSPRTRRCGRIPVSCPRSHDAENERLLARVARAAAPGRRRDDAAHRADRRAGRARSLRPGRARPPAGRGARRDADRSRSCTSTTRRRRSRSPSRAISTASYNVAADGWLVATRPRARARRQRPAGAARRGRRAACCRRCGRAGSATRRRRCCPYLVHPWVVANDRLRARGLDAGALERRTPIARVAARSPARATARRRVAAVDRGRRRGTGGDRRSASRRLSAAPAAAVRRSRP